MTEIPKNHPRAKSLLLREQLVDGVVKGLASTAGLIAYGRGEAYYYLLGERTHAFAKRAVEAASAMLLTATHPVFSVNGNVAAVAADAIVELSRVVQKLRLEVNIFHFDEERLERIADHLKQAGANEVLGLGKFEELAGLESARRRMDVRGIARADVVLVPLEDGDRCEALVDSGRKVITVDLNPFARTSQKPAVNQQRTSQVSLQGIFSLTTAVAIVVAVAPMIQAPSWKSIALSAAFAMSYLGAAWFGKHRTSNTQARTLHERPRAWKLDATGRFVVFCIAQIAAIMICHRLGIASSLYLTAFIAQSTLTLAACGIEHTCLGREPQTSEDEEAAFLMPV